MNRGPDAPTVAVVGGGPSGLAAAALLAARGCRVVLLEALPQVGGAAGRMVVDDVGWDIGATATLWPDVFRDLFRRTGAPLEEEVALERLPVVREHYFTDGTSVALVPGTPEDQADGLAELGPGTAWADHVRAYDEAWDLLGEDFFRGGRPAETRGASRLLAARRNLHQSLRAGLPDERLRSIAAHPYLRDGHNLRSVPLWAGVTAHLEGDGLWTVRGGLWQLTEALERRCRQLGVEIRLATSVVDLEAAPDRVTGVRTEHDLVAADAVVVAADPRSLPALRERLRAATPVAPPYVLYLAVPGARAMPAEAVLHGATPLTIRTAGGAGDITAWSVTWTRGAATEIDVLERLRDSGLLGAGAPVEEQRLLRPLDLHRWWRGSPLGVRWDGDVTDPWRPRRALAGVHLVGAHVARGPGLPFAVASAYGVADAIRGAGSASSV